ncbi:PDZ domain-containing protein [soil metagenome]
MIGETGVVYRLSMPAPHTHLLEVACQVKDVGAPIRLVMPSWTPGSYLLREFARHVQSFAAEAGDGTPLCWTKLDKNRWEVEAPRDGVLQVRYTVYANELTVRTSHLDGSHGYVNGAGVFMYVEGREELACMLQVSAPEGWHVTTSLSCTDASFRAADYHTLIDSPLEIGTHAIFPFDVGGVPHRYAVWGRGNLDPERLVRDTQRIIDAGANFWGGLPYPHFTFLLHLLPGGQGGLEHRDSCSLQADRWAFRGREYEQFLSLVAHEHFHAWNGKRLYPAALGPVDYTRENYTRDLWVVEGLTTYYTDRMLRAAGVITPKRYLERLGDMINRLQKLPGRHRQTLADSSFDSWIRFYRPDENTSNSQISYYQKGALVGLLLDLRIRRLTANRRSLDDVMRLLWERFGMHGLGYPEGALECTAEEVCGAPLSKFFDASLRSTAELNYSDELTAVGLVVTPGAGAGDVQLGVQVREEAGRLRVTQVLAGTPASRGGLNAGDELVALDGLRITGTGLSARLAERPAGQQIQLTVFRRDELLTLHVTPEAVAARPIQLKRAPNPTSLQEAAYRSWVYLDPDRETD